MYMAPIIRARPTPVSPTLRRAVGLPVLGLAGLVVVPWMLAVALIAALAFLGRFAVQATDYAGSVALGR